MYVMMGSPPPEEWDIKDETGTVSKIVSVLNFTKHQRRRVRDIIEHTHHCLLTGESYNPARESREAPYLTNIEDGSRTAQSVADYLECGLSYRETTILINRDQYRAERDCIRFCRL